VRDELILMRDNNGHSVEMIGSLSDFTERKQAETELLAAHNELKGKNAQLHELNTSKDKFFSIISHDLRSPLTTLLGFTQILSNRLNHSNLEQIKHNVDRIQTSAEILYALLENLLTWSRIQRGAMQCEPEEIDLFKNTTENMTIFTPKAEHKGITLRSSIQEHTLAYADYSMVNTILRNLISNALNFTDPGGSVSISATPQEQYLEVAVSDTGRGIGADNLSQLFRIDTHYTRIGTAGEQGTGLGLILCKELIEKNGGRIWVESELGKGSTFRFILPKMPVE
jgi:signal transduction histidine kinase